MKPRPTLFFLAGLACLSILVAASAKAADALPKLLDLGSKQCIPCKQMAPILESLTQEYTGQFEVEFVDVWVPANTAIAEKHGIELIPTQIFFAPDGSELWRHEGFLSKEAILAKWKELGFSFQDPSTTIERRSPAASDSRSPEQICQFCDHTIAPDHKVLVKTDKGDVHICSPHCYFIMLSCLTSDPTVTEANARASTPSGEMVQATSAWYIATLETTTGRPNIRAFESKTAALEAQQLSGGLLLDYELLKSKELAHRCGFCDRALYPEDAASVRAGGLHTYGCCCHCALGVAARTGLDIEVIQPDALTREPVRVTTLAGKIASVEPSTAVAWFGMKQQPNGSWGSAGCFHQGFFAHRENLEQWLAANPMETGTQISFEKALEDKMQLSPEQIQKACKLGECTPK